MFMSRLLKPLFGAILTLSIFTSSAAQTPPVAKAEDARTAALSAVLPVDPT